MLKLGHTTKTMSLKELILAKGNFSGFISNILHIT